MASSGSKFFSFVVGAAVGAAFGVLYAPDKGKNSRDKLSFKLDKYKDLLQEIVDDILDGKEDIVSEAKTESEKVIQDTYNQAQSLMDEIDKFKLKITEQDTNEDEA